MSENLSEEKKLKIKKIIYNHAELLADLERDLDDSDEELINELITKYKNVLDKMVD